MFPKYDRLNTFFAILSEAIKFRLGIFYNMAVFDLIKQFILKVLLTVLFFH